MKACVGQAAGNIWAWARKGEIRGHSPTPPHNTPEELEIFLTSCRKEDVELHVGTYICRYIYVGTYIHILG